MEQHRPSTDITQELEELRKKYNELQLRITRFSVTEQELIHARNRLDREVLIYRRMHHFNSQAFQDKSDDEFTKMVCETLLDIFEVEVGLMIVELPNHDAPVLIHVEGYPVKYLPPEKLKHTIQLLTENKPLGEAYHLSLSEKDELHRIIPFKNLILTKVKDPELQFTVILLCGNSEKGSRFYEDIGSDREAAFSVFAQQVLAHQTNRYKTQKIKQHVNALTQDRERITRIAESFLKFNTEPEKNIIMIVRLAAELLSAECAVLETLDEQRPLFSIKEISDAYENFPSDFHPCNELMRQSGQEMLIVPRLHLKPDIAANGWIQRFEGKSFIGSVIYIDRQPIGTLALFIDPQRVITDNLLQLIRLLSVAIAVEERRRRALFALKESEEKYRVIFEGSPNGIVVVDIESLELKYVNPYFCRMFGYTSEEMLTMTVDQLHPSHIRKVVIYAIQGNESQSNLLTNDLACLRKDGSVFFADIYSNNISFGGRKLVTGFFSDVTQRRNDQEALLNSNTALKKINAELDNFVYSVSHDLRAPLLAIQGLIRLIAESKDKLSGENSNYLNMVISSVNRMDDTIKEILEYSRNARLDIHVRPIDFRQMINEIFLDVKHIFPGSLTLDIKIKGKEEFYSDPYRVNTLFKNLIGNAVKYQRPENNHPYLKIGIQKDEEKAILRFEDNGEGVPAEHIDRIFDMFYRASNTTVGTGLGLYICREIVSNLGGTIEVESTPGKGSVFTVHLKNLNS